jgi:transcriptional regulator with XRE-family HTH domain
LVLLSFVYRQQVGHSQEKLVAKAGLDRTYFDRAERGERHVVLVDVIRLVEALE